MRESLGLLGEFAPEENLLDEPIWGLAMPACLTKLHVPHGCPGPRADSVWTLNLRVVRGENSDTTIA